MRWNPPSIARSAQTPTGKFIPYAVLDAGGRHGVYIGIEWSYCRIAAVAADGRKPGGVRVRGGEFEGFKINIAPGETFEAPPAFVGAYRGDVDDAGNSLRKYLFHYNMPEVVRKDATYPKVQWNAFGATGDKPASLEKRPAQILPADRRHRAAGFSKRSCSTWDGGKGGPARPSLRPTLSIGRPAWPRPPGTRTRPGCVSASTGTRARRWPIAKAAIGACAHVRRLYHDYKADMWRSDLTGGPVVSASYPSVRGFYAMLDQLNREIPSFQWENCCDGGRIKDFGAMKHSVKVFMTDTYAPEDVRQAFYDGSFAFPPAN